MYFNSTRSGTLSFALAIAVAIAGGASTRGFSAALVGSSRHLDSVPGQSIDLDELKAQYRRPAHIPFPDDNRYTVEKEILGRKLFFDPRLSLNSTKSCSSCHSPGFGWSDGMPLGIGQQRLERHSPTIVNAAWGETFMWDGRAASLEDQVLGPIESSVEMNMPIELLMMRLASIVEYRRLFAAAFPETGLTAKGLAEAIATFERTVVSGWSPFDSWVEGDERAISVQARRGFVVFNGKGGCAGCHDGWNFTNDGFHDIGLPDADTGRGKLQPHIEKMAHAFKTPGLRDVAVRAPYMHDGSITTLEEVVDHYDSGGVDRPSRSDLMIALGLNSEEKADIVAFLRSLSGTSSQFKLPVLPR